MRSLLIATRDWGEAGRLGQEQPAQHFERAPATERDLGEIGDRRQIVDGRRT